MPSNITIYRPNMRHELGFFRTWAVMAHNVWGARELIWQLFKRDFFAQYKKSFIGAAWVFISPVVGIVSWVFLQRTGLLRPGDVDVPYPVYVLVGSSMWGLFVGLLKGAGNTLASGKELLMQVNYPHEALLFKEIGQQVANFLIAFAMNLVVMLLFGVIPSWGVLLLPLVALPLFFLAAAAGLILSMVGAVMLDVSKMVDALLGVLIYTIPVIYSDQVGSPVVRAMIRWNPLAYLVCSCRDVVLYGRLYRPAGYFLAAGISLAAFMVAWRLFYVCEDKIVERMV